MIPTLAAIVWKWAAYGGFACTAAALVFAAVGHRRGLAYALWGRYTGYLGARMRALHVFTPVSPIAATQLAGVLLAITLGAFGKLPFWYLAVALIAGAPALVIERRLRKRVEKLDAQAGAFALTLANAMKATPSMGQAVEHVAALMDGPVAQEMQLAMKEVRLGKTFNEALVDIVPRCGSTKLGTVIISLLIGRQLGGNVITTLDTTATTLRELERLDGVLRQRTAEGRMQLYAMMLAPFVLGYGAYKVDARYFEPLLTNGLLGHLCIAGAAIGYAAALIAARRIITVDL
ncbi:MAG: type II secretion system F family protein [Labilithrix sp.]|nr:type II secretion system F family protein [Labilithrix sp.]